MTASFKSGKPVMMDYTPAAAILAGDVVVIGATPCVAHVDNPPFGTTTIKDALAVRGGIYAIPTDGTPVKGQDVFFNTTSGKLTATAAGNVHFGVLLAGPTGDMVGASPTTDGDIGYAMHSPRGSGSISSGKSEAVKSTTATLTAAEVLGGFISSVPAGAITLTLPTAALMVSYESPELITRDELMNTHAFAVLICERYVGEAAGRPPKEWMDERVLFVEEKVFKVLRNPDLVLLDSFIPVPGELGSVDLVYDRDLYMQRRTFWSWASFQFQEVTTA